MPVAIGIPQPDERCAKGGIDCAHDREAVSAAIRRAADPVFRASLAGLRNPYGDGHASERIVSRSKAIEMDDRLLVKKFVDLAVPS